MEINNLLYPNDIEFLKNKHDTSINIEIQNDIKTDIHNCNIAYSCELSNLPNILSENNFDDISTINSDFIGGAPSSKSNSKKKHSNAIKVKNNAIEIKKIGDDLIDIIINNYSFLYQNNNINDNKLIETIYQLIKDKKIIITQLEFELLLRYIRENIFPTLKTLVIKKHSLLDMIKNDDYMTKLYLVKEAEHISYNHKQIVAVTKAMSAEWNGLQDLMLYGNKRICFKNDLIDPLFVLLYANKLPGFEDLSILQDYPTLLEEIKHNDFNKENLSLLLLRIADPNLLHVKNSNHLSNINNENLRISITILLRNLAYSIRSGTFENNMSATLLNLLQDFNMPGSTFEEENLLQAILSVYCFKPTLITEASYSNFMSFTSPINTDTVHYSVPRAVYNIEYPLMDFYTYNYNNTIETPIFSDNNFHFLGYDHSNKKVFFTYNTISSQINNPQQTQEDLLLNLYKFLNTKKAEVNLNDIASTLIMRPGQLETIYKNTRPVSVLLSNGMFVVSIPRIQRRITTTDNLFLQTNNKLSINLSPILFEQNININRTSYALTGALCYDILETNDLNFSSIFYTDIQSKVGTYCIVKAGNFWIEYNPNNILLRSRYMSRIDRALQNHYEMLASQNPNLNFEEWKKSEEATKISKSILNNKISIIDMKISEQEALEKISTRACILIYSEPYEEYRLKAENLNF